MMVIACLFAKFAQFPSHRDDAGQVVVGGTHEGEKSFDDIARPH
jgi:hypothetical protein